MQFGIYSTKVKSFTQKGKYQSVRRARRAVIRLMKDKLLSVWDKAPAKLELRMYSSGKTEGVVMESKDEDG